VTAFLVPDLGSGTGCSPVSGLAAEGFAVVGLRNDPRYDTLDEFKAYSQVQLPTACDRIREAFGRQHGLDQFFVDCEPDGEVVWGWVEERGPSVGLYVSSEDRFLTDAEVASGVRPMIQNPYYIMLRFNTHVVSWEEEDRIRAAIAAAFECKLVPCR
jgi:hypothetical protein